MCLIHNGMNINLSIKRLRKNIILIHKFLKEIFPYFSEIKNYTLLILIKTRTT